MLSPSIYSHRDFTHRCFSETPHITACLLFRLDPRPHFWLSWGGPFFSVRFRRASASPRRLLLRHRWARFSLSIVPVASPATAGRLLVSFAPLPMFPCPVHVLMVAQCMITVAIMGLFTLLSVRRKELERHAKREFRKALHLLTAFALDPCTRENSGVVFTISNTPDGGCVSCMHLRWKNFGGWLTEEPMPERRLCSSVQTVSCQFVKTARESSSVV